MPYAPRAGCGERASADVSHLGPFGWGPVIRYLGPFGRPDDFLPTIYGATMAGHSPRSAHASSDRLTIAMLDLSVGVDGESAFRSLVDWVRS